MRTIALPGVRIAPSVIVQGAMGLLNVEEPEAFACLDAAIDAGINAFDTSHVYAYGDRSVDALLGQWINRTGGRDHVVLMAKGCHPEPPDWTTARVNPDAVAVDVADSLDRMDLDRLDLWSFHRDDVTVDVGELVEAANAQVQAGTIDAWGVSNWGSARIQAAIAYAEGAGLVAPVLNSAHYSLVDQVEPPWDDVVTLTGDVGAVDRTWHLDTGLPLVAWSALAGGVLSSNLTRTDFEQATEGHLADVYRSYHSEPNWERRQRAEEVADRLGLSLSDVAIAWLLQSDLAPFAIVGGAGPDEIRANARAAEITLSAEDLHYLHEPGTIRT